MKKYLLIILSLFSISVIWCTTSNEQITKIDSTKWETSFNNQIENSQYINDFEDFISYNILSITEDKPYSSDFSLSAEFDKDSSIQWWVEFYQNKFSQKHDLETSDIVFNVKAESSKNDKEPFETSWNVSILYQNNEVYAKLHNLNVFMGEGNMTAKMYNLLWNLIMNNRVNLEVNSWRIISIDESEDKKLPYIIWTIKNVLKTENLHDSPNFLWSITELIDTINSYIDLWISTNELALTNEEISYFELSDKSIQKEFTGSFQWKDSAFDTSFIASKKWIKIHIYNIKEFDEDISNYKDTETEFLFSIQWDKKSEYLINFESIKLQQKIVNLEWKIKYNPSSVQIYADFILEPLEIIAGQKISWNLNLNITKQPWNPKNKSTELTWEILLLSEILSSL